MNKLLNKVGRELANRWKKLFRKVYQNLTHAEAIKQAIESNFSHVTKGNFVFVETGSGFSTVMLSDLAIRFNAKVYSCDHNEEKVNAFRNSMKSRLENVVFLFGDSIESLKRITEKEERVDFLFLDSAPSAMHTFREFFIMEPLLKHGTCLLIDNAALPSARLVLSPCRKGKIIVPYLMASLFWKVMGLPRAGDSMVLAMRDRKPLFADHTFEHPSYIDPWQVTLNKFHEQSISFQKKSPKQDSL